MTQLSPFEQNLLAELRQAVTEQAGSRAADVPSPRGRARPRTRIALVAVGGGLLSAGLLVGPPAFEGVRAPAASAVETNEDGTVTVMVTRPQDAAEVERALAERGIAAEIDLAPDGMTCVNTPPRYERDPAVDELAVGRIVSSGDGSFSLTLRPDHLRGRTLVVEHSARVEESGMWTTTTVGMSVGVAVGPVAPCELVAAGG